MYRQSHGNAHQMPFRIEMVKFPKKMSSIGRLRKKNCIAVEMYHLKKTGALIRYYIQAIAIDNSNNNYKLFQENRAQQLNNDCHKTAREDK